MELLEVEKDAVIEEVNKKLELSDDCIDNESITKIAFEKPWKLAFINKDASFQHLLWQRALNVIDDNGRTIEELEIIKEKKNA